VAARAPGRCAWAARRGETDPLRHGRVLGRRGRWRRHSRRRGQRRRGPSRHARSSGARFDGARARRARFDGQVRLGGAAGRNRPVAARPGAWAARPVVARRGGAKPTRCGAGPWRDSFQMLTRCTCGKGRRFSARQIRRLRSDWPIRNALFGPNLSPGRPSNPQIEPSQSSWGRSLRLGLSECHRGEHLETSAAESGAVASDCRRRRERGRVASATAGAGPGGERDGGSGAGWRARRRERGRVASATAGAGPGGERDGGSGAGWRARRRERGRVASATAGAGPGGCRRRSHSPEPLPRKSPSDPKAGGALAEPD
jgi:hypothetical protein